jgi:hypothetical protein
MKVTRGIIPSRRALKSAWRRARRSTSPGRGPNFKRLPASSMRPIASRNASSPIRTALIASW